MTQVTGLTLPMLGGHPDKCDMTLKAAETKYMIPFAVGLLDKFKSKFAPVEAAKLIEAGQTLWKLCKLVDESGPVLTPSQLQQMYDAAKRHIVLCAAAGAPLRPKAHLLLHMVARSRRHGNPKLYALWEDESINRNLRQIAEAAHRAVWESRVLACFPRVEVLRSGRVQTKRARGE